MAGRTASTGIPGLGQWWWGWPSTTQASTTSPTASSRTSATAVALSAVLLLWLAHTCCAQDRMDLGSGQPRERHAALRALLGNRAVTDEEAHARVLAALRRELEAPCDTPGVPASGTGLSASESLVCAYAEALGTVTTPEELDRLRKEAPAGEPLARWLLIAEARARALAAYETCADGDAPKVVGGEETVRGLEDLLSDPYDLLRARAAIALGDLQALEAADALQAVLRDPAFRDVTGLVDYGILGKPNHLYLVRLEARLALLRMGHELRWVSDEVWEAGPHSELRRRYQGVGMAVRALRGRRDWGAERKVEFCLSILRREIETPGDAQTDVRTVPDSYTTASEGLQMGLVHALASVAEPEQLRRLVPESAESRYDLALLSAYALCLGRAPRTEANAAERAWAARQVLRVLRGNASDAVRAMAALCLGELGAPGPPEPEVRDALLEALKDEAFRRLPRAEREGERFYMVRLTAAGALQRLGVRVKLVDRVESRYELEENAPAGAPGGGGAMFRGP